MKISITNRLRLFCLFGFLLCSTGTMAQLVNDPPSVPGGLQVTSIDHYHVTITWNASTHVTGIKRYPIWTSQTVWGEADKFSSTNSYTISFNQSWWSLPGQWFRLRVQAESNNDLLSEPGQDIVINIPPDYSSALPSTPTNLQAYNINSTGFNVSWNASTHNTGILYYVVQSQTAGPHFIIPPARYDTVRGSNTLQILRANYQQYNNAYYIKVKAVSNAYTESPFSNVLVVPAFNQNNTNPSAPTGLRYRDLTQNGFTLSWNPSVSNDSINRYEIIGIDCDAFGPSAPTFRINVGSVTTSIHITNNRVYRLCIQIRAFSSNNNSSAWSDTLTIPIYNPNIVTAPSNVSYSTLTQQGFTLHWNASITNALSAISKYEISGKDCGFFSPLAPDFTIFADRYTTSTLITNYRNYKLCVKIRAIDSSGNISPWSNTIEIPIYNPKATDEKESKKSSGASSETVKGFLNNPEAGNANVINNGSTLSVILPEATDKNSILQLYDMNGRLRKNMVYQNKLTNINIIGINEGIYVIRWSEKGVYRTKQIVILK